MKQIFLFASVIVLVFTATGCVGLELRRSDEQRAEIAQESVQHSSTRSAQWRQSTTADFEAGIHFKTRAIEVGDGAVSLDSSAREGTFTSATKQADFPFNAIGAVQNSRVPKGASVEIEVRTSENGKEWSNWVAVHAQAPSQDGKDDAETQIITIKAGRFLQYRVLLSSPGEPPVLEDVTITYINSTSGPNMEAAKKAVLPKSAGQPTIISREGWGANEKYRRGADGKEIWPAETRKPVKIIIHHTLTPNEDPNGPATVRAIYYYHAVTLGWGDVGYNYLVDAAGNIYEGRRGDSVVAGHAYGHNYGSIGIAVLGDYLTSEVSDPTRKALVELLAWLTDKYAIDPRGRSFFVDHELPNISGHQDTNETSCPGTNLYARIPDLRKATFDKVPPSTVKIETPADAATVTGSLLVKLNQQDKWPLSKVEYFVDDKPAATVSKPDWSWNLDTAKLAEGQHVLKAVVTNALGKQSSATRGFNVGKPPAVTWYFAEGSTSSGYQTWLLLMNANLVPARATITVFDEAGKTERREVQVGPKSRLNASVNAIAANRAMGIKVEADQVIYAERAIYFGHDGHTAPGTTSLSKTWYFAEGSTETSFDTWFLVMNPHDSRARLNVTYYKADGSTVAKAYEAGPASRLNIWANKDVPATAFATKIEADIPVVAERSMYFDRGRGGHNTVGAASPSPTWYFAEGAGGSDFNTWILLLNPNGEPARVTATLLRENAQPQTVTYTVPPKSRMNIWANKVAPPGPVATKIQADRPIVAERSMYWADSKAGHNTVGAIAPANQWFLPEGSATPFNEWILLMNPDGEAARVTLTFLDERGNTLAKTYQVAGNSRLNIWVNQILTASAISTLVQSDRPIVVERSSYTADNMGGTNSMGIPR